MKPLKLHLKNIGPFLDETLDFETLNEMFLVSGKTGSGKTTIFDSITYALYGDTTGSRSISNFHLHSDFADPKEESFVDFTFLLNGNKYNIYRSTSWEYVNRNGNISRTAIKASFRAWDNSSGTWKDFPGTATQLDAKIKDLIGLSCEEFTKIVILPQGEFAKFLHENSASRRDTLLKLFPVGIYTQIAKEIADQAKQQKDHLELTEHNLKEAQDNPLVEDSEQQLEQITGQLEQLSTIQKEAAKNMQSSSAKLQELSSKQEAALKARKLSQKLSELESKKADYENLEKRIALATEAVPLSQSVENYKKASSKLEADQNDYEKTKHALEEAEELYSSLSKQKDSIEKKKDSCTQKKTQQAELEKQFTIISEIYSAHKSLVDSIKSLDSSVKKADSLSALLSKQSDILSKELEEIKQNQDRTKTTLEDLEKQKREKEINDAAGFLASTLEQGKPCPVCGSTEHPSCAKQQQFTLNLEELIENEKKNLQNAEKLLKNSQKDFDENQTLINLHSSLCVQLKSESEQTQKEYVSLQESFFGKTDAQDMISKDSEKQPLPQEYSRNDFNDFSKEADKIKKDANTSLSRLQTLLMQNKNLAGKTEETLNKEIECIKKEIKAIEKETSSFQEDLSNAETQYTKLSERKTFTEKLIKQDKTETEKALAEKTQKLSSSSFKSEKQVMDSLIEPEELDQLKTDCENFKAELLTTQTSLKEQNSKPEEYESILKEASVLKEELVKIQAESEDASEKEKQLVAKKTEIQTAVKTLTGLIAQEKELREKNQTLFQLDRDINGKNPRKILFDTWVLGTFLEDIVTSANIHFAQISASRYCFILKTDGGKGNGFKGLDLSVYDSFTGKERESTSLSGGETFMASLSLALALTDVVQSRSGSIRLDSLFIDEGFGSLDGEALENAVAILNTIREERMVGIISHVESLENAIPCHVNVIKKNTGSTISIS